MNRSRVHVVKQMLQDVRVDFLQKEMQTKQNDILRNQRFYRARMSTGSDDMDGATIETAEQAE